MDTRENMPSALRGKLVGIKLPATKSTTANVKHAKVEIHFSIVLQLIHLLNVINPTGYLYIYGIICLSNLLSDDNIYHLNLNRKVILYTLNNKSAQVYLYLWNSVLKNPSHG